MICNLIFTQREYPRFAKFSRGYLKKGSIEINRGTTFRIEGTRENIIITVRSVRKIFSKESR